MKRALMYASVASMIQQFNMENIKLLQELGYHIDVACNFEFGNTIPKGKIDELKIELQDMNVNIFHIPVPRKLGDVKNMALSFAKTYDLLNDKKYELVHCHSPIGGIVCRIAGALSKNRKYTKMIYTAHGFHFFKGNSRLKNFIFKTIERIGARFTDVLITINREDYLAAKQFKMKKNGVAEYVPGVGVDCERIHKISSNRESLLKELGLDGSVKLMLSVGELNENKNHIAVLEALPELDKTIHYVVCGQGVLQKELYERAEVLGVRERFHLLGYRNDIPQIMKSVDWFVFPSKREGLSVALMEAIASGLPCIVSEIRGNVDLIIDKSLGYTVDIACFTQRLIEIVRSEELIVRSEELKEVPWSKKNISLRMRNLYER